MCEASLETGFGFVLGSWEAATSWGGSIDKIFGVQNQDINTSSEIWKFFSQNPRGSE
jgi:hypothetical protein